MKNIIIAITLVTLSLIGFLWVFEKNDRLVADQNSAPIVTDGKQTIEIAAKGGYLPQSIKAQADIPTILKITTAGTFDCSSALVIPILGYRNNLPATGETLIDVPPQEAGKTLRGLCAMGMYGFEIQFN